MRNVLLAWARKVEGETELFNGAADVFEWNHDKAYLTDLGDLRVVPTALLDDAHLVSGLQAAVDRFGTVVITPPTGAGGVGVVVAQSTSDPRLEGLTAGPWIVEPLVESVRNEGESSVYVFDGLPPYARVDMMRYDGELAIGELELIEPGLYLDVIPDNAGRFAELVARHL